MYKKRRGKIKKVIAAIKSGARLFHALKSSGVSRSTWNDWEKQKPRLEKLRRAAEEAKDETALNDVEDAFVKKLKSGKAHPIEYIFFFTNRDPLRWKDKRAMPSAVALTKVDVNNGTIPDSELAEIKDKQDALLGRLTERLGI